MRGGFKDYEPIKDLPELWIAVDLCLFSMATDLVATIAGEQDTVEDLILLGLRCLLEDR
jgi:hypothetical protein